MARLEPRPLSPEEGELLRSLLDHPGFSVLTRRLIEAEVTALQQGMDKGDTEFEKGLYAGLRRARELPRWMLLDLPPLPGKDPDYPDESPGMEHVDGNDVSD